MKIKGTEPAYPIVTEVRTSIHSEQPNTMMELTDSGITIRQRFAMAAMQGILSGIHANENVLSKLLKSSNGLKIKPQNNIAEMAIEYADGLIEELNKEKK